MQLAVPAPRAGRRRPGRRCRRPCRTGSTSVSDRAWRSCWPPCRHPRPAPRARLDPPGQDRAAARDEEHDGLRVQLIFSTTPASSRRGQHRGQRGHARVHRRDRHAHGASLYARRHPRCSCSTTTSLEKSAHCRSLVRAGPAHDRAVGRHLAARGQTDPQADALLRGLSVREAGRAARGVPGPTAADADALATDATGVLAGLPVTGPGRSPPTPRAGRAVAHPQGPLHGGRGRPPVRHDGVLEDIVVPVPALLPTCERLTALFDRHGYADGVIFGHAKDGNIHFMLTERLPAARSTASRGSPRTWSQLILDQGGSLKAEHGTGRMMAPFVRRQYGDELYAAMQEIKRLCDPGNVLNPGVVLTDDPDAPPARPQDRPRGRARGRPVRGVRLLRAGLPEPRPHDHAAPADRAAPGDAAGQGGGRRGARRGARGRVRLRGHRDLRGRRHVPDRVPGPDQHRRPRQAAAAGAAGRGGERGVGGRRAALGARHAGGGGRRWTCRRAAHAVGRGGDRAGPQGGRPGRAARVVAGPAPRRDPAPGPAPDAPDAVFFASCTGTMFGPAGDGAGATPRSPHSASGPASR